MLHYCIDDENDQTASACGYLFSDKDALTHLTREADKVWCSNCMQWMKKRGILPGDRGKLVKVMVFLTEEDHYNLVMMASEASVTHAELMKQLLRRAARDRQSLLEPGEE